MVQSIRVMQEPLMSLYVTTAPILIYQVRCSAESQYILFLLSNLPIQKHGNQKATHLYFYTL